MKFLSERSRLSENRLLPLRLWLSVSLTKIKNHLKVKAPVRPPKRKRQRQGAGPKEKARAGARAKEKARAKAARTPKAKGGWAP
jgi:hypothetical protein